MSDLAPNSPNPESRSRITSPADLIGQLATANANNFYGIVVALRGSGSDIGERATLDQKKEIFFSLLNSAVCLRTEIGSQIGPAISGIIVCDVLKYFDPANYCEEISVAEKAFIKELENEDQRMAELDSSAPKIARLTQHPGCIRDLLIFSLGYMIMSQPSNDLTKAAETFIREIPETEQFNSYGSSTLADIFSRIKNPGLLADIGRMCLGKTFALRIADYFRQASDSVLSGELDPGLVEVQKLFFAKFLEKVLALKNMFAKAEKNWSKISDSLNIGYGPNSIVSGPDDFIDYIYSFGAQKHVIQPALAALCRDMEGKPVGETAKATLKALLNNSEQEVTNLIVLDWDSIYAHAQLDYAFES